MKNKYDFEDQLDQIHIDIYESQNGLSPSQAAEAQNHRAKAIAKKYGIAITKAPVVRCTLAL